MSRQSVRALAKAIGVSISICGRAAAQSAGAAAPAAEPATPPAPVPAVSAPAAPAPPASAPAEAAPATAPVGSYAAPSAVPPPPPPPPGYYAPYPYPRSYYYPPPESEPRKRSSRIFLQLGLGPGLFRAHNSSKSDERRFSGGTFSGQFVLGGRAGRVVAIGAAFIHDQVFDLSSKDQLIDGDEPDLSSTTFTIDTLAFFLDFRVPSLPGLHFPGYAGFSTIGEHAAGNSRSSDPTLFLGSVGAGYEFAVGAHYYLGALLRASLAEYTIRENTGTDVTTFVPALLLTATYDPSR